MDASHFGHLLSSLPDDTKLYMIDHELDGILHCISEIGHNDQYIMLGWGTHAISPEQVIDYISRHPPPTALWGNLDHRKLIVVLNFKPVLITPKEMHLEYDGPKLVFNLTGAPEMHLEYDGPKLVFNLTGAPTHEVKL